MRRPEVGRLCEPSPVYLNVYDMCSVNRYLWKVGLGVYHSGVEIFNKEYSFGGYPSERSGIFAIEPRSATTLVPSFSFKISILIGYTRFNEETVRQLLDQMGRTHFRANKYHLFRNNCNDFTNAFIESLCSNSIPDYVNRMARIGTRIPLLEAVLPNQVLTPVLTMMTKEAKTRTNDNSGATRVDRISCRSNNYIV